MVFSGQVAKNVRDLAANRLSNDRNGFSKAIQEAESQLDKGDAYIAGEALAHSCASDKY